MLLLQLVFRTSIISFINLDCMPRHRFTVLIQSLGMQNKSLDYPFHLQFPIWMRFVWSERPTALLQQITRAKKCAPCVCHSPFRTIMATPLSNLGGASQILPTRPTLRRDSKPQSRWLTVTMSASKNREPKCYPVQVTRRASVSIAMASLLQQLGIGSSQAEEGNGLWLTGPLPVPAVTSGKLLERGSFRQFDLVHRRIWRRNPWRQRSPTRRREPDRSWEMEYTWRT